MTSPDLQLAPPPELVAAEQLCVPVAELRPFVLDALSGINDAVAKDRSRASTIQLVRARLLLGKLLDLLPE